ncbi:MAG: exosome complex protein Rrp4 [Nanoarchaeota archaeon]|nr:exosome complex protein Rrp4 [Nanoarchaeota archaeon]MBU1623334.1 exosome complex protein Rrp4 [Nanoarchaeota archaeon]MBU1974061.1 exosome complex protein Rrp4 [Nanoarchaeota archaeon]
MSMIKEQRSIVIPGEALAEGMDFLPGENTYRKDDKIYAKVLGLVSLAGHVVKLTPLSGPYVPKVGDKIIGKVVDIAMSGWRLDTATAYTAMMNMKDASSRFIRNNEDLSQILAIGEYAVVKITKVTSQMLIDLTMKEPGLHKVAGGRIIKINSQKVPRVIGKQGSMISLIKEKTGCTVTIGQNGLVWIKGESDKELLAEKAIKLIQEKSHQPGLTDKIQAFLEGSQ